MSTDRPNARRHKPRVSNVTAAGLALLAIFLACYLVFGGAVPFSKSPFVLRAVFTANTNLHIPSPVRIAGVDVGEVTGVQQIKGSRNAGIVTMQIDSNGLPIHADATADIRSRIFLEGNFYVDLEPGSPSSPILQSGATLPAANTAGPVQLDRVLSALTSNSRANLQRLVRGLGDALNGPPTAADEAGQSPSDKDMTGAQALNYALKYSAGAFEASALVNQALLGERPHDLSGVVRGESEVFSGLAASGNQLSDLVVSFDRTMSALADRQQALSATVAVLPSLLRATDAADKSLDASFAPTQRFAAAVIPGIEQVAPTVAVALPWVEQLSSLVSQSELGGLVRYLKPAVQKTTVALRSTETLISESNELAQCFTHTLLPTGNEKITEDPSDDDGLELYQELFQSAVGLASSTQNFDGNGRYGSATLGGGDNLVQTPATSQQGPLYANSVFPGSDLHTLPDWSSNTAPKLDAAVPCMRETPPDLNGAKEGNGP